MSLKYKQAGPHMATVLQSDGHGTIVRIHGAESDEPLQIDLRFPKGLQIDVTRKSNGELVYEPGPQDLLAFGWFT